MALICELLGSRGQPPPPPNPPTPPKMLAIRIATQISLTVLPCGFACKHQMRRIGFVVLRDQVQPLLVTSEHLDQLAEVAVLNPLECLRLQRALRTLLPDVWRALPGTGGEGRPQALRVKLGSRSRSMLPLDWAPEAQGTYLAQDPDGVKGEREPICPTLARVAGRAEPEHPKLAAAIDSNMVSMSGVGASTHRPPQSSTPELSYTVTPCVPVMMIAKEEASGWSQGQLLRRRGDGGRKLGLLMLTHPLETTASRRERL